MITVESKIDQFGRLIIPNRIRKVLALKPGDIMEIKIENGILKLIPVALDKKAKANVKAFDTLMKLNKRHQKKIDETVDLAALANEVNE